MKSFLTLLATTFLTTTSLASAHGFLQAIIVDGVSYPGWAPFSDPYITPAPVRYTRSFKDNGPVVDFTGKNITCNNGPNAPLNVNIPVKAGSKVYGPFDDYKY